MKSTHYKIVLFLALCACGSGEPFKSVLDGDRPIIHVVDPELIAMLSEPKRSLFLQAAKETEKVWNPDAIGEPQLINIRYAGANNKDCIDNNYFAWTSRGDSDVYICDSWIGYSFCTNPKQTRDYYGLRGCKIIILHEDLHKWGMRGHPIERNGRDEHTSGPIGCNWSLDCADPDIVDYWVEDRQAACRDGAWGKVCDKYR